MDFWLGEFNVKANGVAGTAILFIWCGFLPIVGTLWLLGWLK